LQWTVVMKLCARFTHDCIWLKDLQQEKCAR
jgi:hypothetical protein